MSCYYRSLIDAALTILLLNELRTMSYHHQYNIL
jgi:hypothetical protein